jgi:hypothetical protein
MWTAIFIITIIASIGFALVAASSRQTRNAAPHRNQRPDSSEASVRAPKTAPIDAELPSATLTAFLEPALLPRRMRRLQIDLEEFFCTEPLLFRELAARCRQCSSAMQCERDLADPWASDDAWKDYCPNASVLNAISTFGGVGTGLSPTAGSTASSTSVEQARAVIRH